MRGLACLVSVTSAPVVPAVVLARIVVRPPSVVGGLLNGFARATLVSGIGFVLTLVGRVSADVRTDAPVIRIAGRAREV